jgi:Tfp pilus assembly protein PilN
MRAVNLLPVESAAQQKRLAGGQVLLAATAPLVAAALIYVGFTYEHAKVSDVRATVQVAQAELSGLGPAATVATAGRQLAGERTSRFQALRDALGRRFPWDTTLDQVARVLPPDVWLTELDAQSPTPTTVSSTSGATSSSDASSTTTSTTATTTTSSADSPPPVTVAAPAIFSLSGYALTNEGIAQALARLALVPTLTNVALVSTASIAIGAKQVVQFQISASIAGSAS